MYFDLQSITSLVFLVFFLSITQNLVFTSAAQKSEEGLYLFGLYMGASWSHLFLFLSWKAFLPARLACLYVGLFSSSRPILFGAFSGQAFYMGVYSLKEVKQNSFPILASYLSSLTPGRMELAWSDPVSYS